ncbi:hypothetical protein PMI42_04857 [Bradyrhizobium sp. YR681]|uniref:hypothetical protein n=1 Tax=Bradyrhizobium sp. YR681 TaxID=1144344 RepID=UPI0002710D3E|nr:hypothetical protein [Bradyrhizobium sp. YR681]EJN11842.1 hypothetical protein PMI42_04857 [Bradyrhizobium sp. YR681]
MKNAHFVEKNQVVLGFKPVAMNTAANNGDYVSLKGYARCAVIFIKAVGTAGDDPTLSFKQATDVSGTGVKALGVTRIDKKQAATDLTAVGTFTKSTTDSPATNDTFNTTNGTWTNSDLAEQAAIVVADIKAEDLDIANGFDCITCNVGDVGTNAQLGTLIFVLHEPRNMKETLDSAIVD